MNLSGGKRSRRRPGRAVAFLLVIASGAAEAGVNVTTHHYDAYRTGWNGEETILTPTNLETGGFGMLHTITLDDQVDAQPLVVNNQAIAGKGRHEVVYVATESNTVYAFDAASGDELLRANLGPPVPQSVLPGKCNNNALNIGITGTPVIDVSHETLYAISYTQEVGGPVYRIHALDLKNLRDRVPAPLVGGVPVADAYRFDASVNRQRAALVLANGNVYAGFGSFCDLRPSASRGRLLAWQMGSLKPIEGRPLTDRLSPSSPAISLSSIWMSGYGPAADRAGMLYMVTGNSDPIGTPQGERDLGESAVAVSGDLKAVSDYFTPQNRDELDETDSDFGAGGIMLVPDQAGPIPRLATAAGKDGNLYLLNRDRLGGFTPGGPDKIVGKFDIGQCFCGQSYFTGADGVGRIVTSGGANVAVWKLAKNKKMPTVTLIREHISPDLRSGQFPGFMTSVSSKGGANGIIWAVSRPVDSDRATVTLYAFDARNAALLLAQPAGTWPYIGGDANIVPVVANGKVFVASYRGLSIFGLHAGAKNVAEAEEGSPSND